LVVDHIPVISVGDEGAPLALWVPALGMSKDDMRPVLDSLAGAGFRAVSLDPWQHGERGTESPDEIRARVFTNFRRHMWPIIGQTTLDCLRVIDRFGDGPVAAGGTSLGGDAAVALAGIDRRVTRVAAIVATPDWTRPGMQTLGDEHVLLDQGEADRYAQWFFDALNPLTHLEAYERDVAIAFLCGAADLHVPAEAASRFRTALCDRDPRAADRVRVELYEGLDHLDAARDERLYSAALAWLAQGG
jgi:dienelactone hydrolase